MSVKIKVNTKLYPLCPEDGCVIVDEKYRKEITKHVLFWNTHGYIKIVLKNKDGYKIMMLHRYIVSNLDNQEIPQNFVVHHINSNRYDNRIENLKITTFSMNNAAIKKIKVSSNTKYKGLYYSKIALSWVAQISYNNRNYHLGQFETDEEAAFVYDIHYYAIHRSIIGSNELLDEETIKNIDINPNEYLPVAKYDNRQLPKYIVQLPSGSYRVRLRMKPHNINKSFIDLDEAKEFIKQFMDNLKEEKEKIKENIIISKPIQRNEEGIPIIPIKNGDETLYALVDEGDYYKLIKIKWNLTTDGYARSSRNGYMHRIIMNCEKFDGKIVDHINQNKLDNRKSVNLRFSTESFSARNKLKKINCSSKYKGVQWKKDINKWVSYITINGKPKYLGCYEIEEDARDAYLKAYKELESQETAKDHDQLLKQLKELKI